MRWRQGSHKFYQEASLPIEVEGRPELNGRIALTAHIARIPRKYGFALLLGSEAALRLDVNPGSTHFDPVSLKSVGGTHWQPWPGSRAIEDERDFNHLGWFNEFVTKTNVRYIGSYRPPPYEGGEQIGLIVP